MALVCIIWLSAFISKLKPETCFFLGQLRTISKQSASLAS